MAQQTRMTPAYLNSSEHVTSPISGLLSKIAKRFSVEQAAEAQALEAIRYQQEDQRLLAQITTIKEQLTADQEALRARGGGSSYALRNAAMEEIAMLQLQRERLQKQARKNGR
jgi:viroplasmin and RNaseH domain-containing protein